MSEKLKEILYEMYGEDLMRPKTKEEADRMWEVHYDSNNSGGKWWLKDNDWEALEAAGWRVGWKGKEYHGCRASDAYYYVDAKSEGESIVLAIEHWEKHANKYANDKGCDCCGPPHNFYAHKNKKR